MPDQTDRLERLVAAEGGAESVTDRIQRLDDLEDALPPVEAHVELLSVLASETRYRIVQLLDATEDDLAVAELDAILGASESAISHALGRLVDQDLVERRRSGKWVYYDTTPRAEEILAALAGVGEE
ncbi:ArsR/SmtB family transcription factor [Halospeciosus flavus]|uniref:ArsR/SmtB family transcription factor n=1 Tax=Halospeciosus flavus TaxID=3032283 RepID=A0ABD5Z927_9EURY|nr:metalloregulator ArsR/SmtB family transcription factor [Halospeciosus flavus]